MFINFFSALRLKSEIIDMKFELFPFQKNHNKTRVMLHVHCKLVITLSICENNDSQI